MSEQDTGTMQSEGKETTGTRAQRCVECNIRVSPRFQLRETADYAVVVAHYLDVHADSERFRDVVNGSFVEVDCGDCGQAFWSPASLTSKGITAEAFCPECTEKEWIRDLIVQDVLPREYVLNEGDPVDDELGLAEVKPEAER